jgi:hypothetical protein
MLGNSANSQKHINIYSIYSQNYQDQSLRKKTLNNEKIVQEEDEYSEDSELVKIKSRLRKDLLDKKEKERP